MDAKSLPAINAAYEKLLGMLFVATERHNANPTAQGAAELDSIMRRIERCERLQDSVLSRG